jgi:hypothetical protein
VGADGVEASLAGAGATAGSGGAGSDGAGLDDVVTGF